MKVSGLYPVHMSVVCKNSFKNFFVLRIASAPTIKKSMVAQTLMVRNESASLPSYDDLNFKRLQKSFGKVCTERWMQNIPHSYKGLPA